MPGAGSEPRSPALRGERHPAPVLQRGSPASSASAERPRAQRSRAGSGGAAAAALGTAGEAPPDPRPRAGPGASRAAGAAPPGPAGVRRAPEPRRPRPLSIPSSLPPRCRPLPPARLARGPARLPRAVRHGRPSPPHPARAPRASPPRDAPRPRHVTAQGRGARQTKSGGRGPGRRQRHSDTGALTLPYTATETAGSGGGCPAEGKEGVLSRHWGISRLGKG